MSPDIFVHRHRATKKHLNPLHHLKGGGVKCMINEVQKRGLYSENVVDKTSLGILFGEIKEQMEDQLAAVNENTNEIQSNYEFLCELDAKMNKMAERMAKIELFLERQGFEREQKPIFEIEPLTSREKDLFLVLYTLEEKGPVTYKELMRASGLTEELVQAYITRLIEKGVPIIKQYAQNTAYLRLERRFKQLQAKENLLNITQKTLA